MGFLLIYGVLDVFLLKLYAGKPIMPGRTEGRDQSTLSIKIRLFKKFRKKVVAIGCVNTNVPFNDEAYNIIIDEFNECFDGNEMLFDKDENFDHITVGETIHWPKYSVHFVRF